MERLGCEHGETGERMGVGDLRYTGTWNRRRVRWRTRVFLIIGEWWRVGEREYLIWRRA